MATRSSPEPLPSIPPSPTYLPTDDIAHAWHDDPEDETSATAHPSAAQKGKKKADRRPTRSSDSDGQGDEDENGADGAAAGGYPPTKEEEAESRRIAENLRRWEVAERQRRKAARESLASTSGGSTAPSILANLFQRESTSRRKASLGGVGTHHVLHDADVDPAGDADGNAVPLADMATPITAAFSAPPTPEPGSEGETENPFDTPSASRTSLNIPAQSATMTKSDSVPAGASSPGSGPKQPKLEASTSYALTANPPPGGKGKGKGKSRSKSTKKQVPPPPPQPLDLPVPRSPPPRTGTPLAGKPPEPIPPPRAERADPESAPDERAAGAVDPGPPVRWWHEWLCGCGEGPDRGGDHQAGRTNPFE